MTASITAVCLVAALHPEHTNPDGLTAIDKRPVRRAVPVGALGLAGDLVKDHRHHGGPEQAVYLYTDEDAAWWAAETGVAIPPGRFGENLRSSGIDVTGAEIGERWRVGADLELVLTWPRIPCATFARNMARSGVPERGWVKRFTVHGAPGGYFSVAVPGDVSAGDAIEVVYRPGHGLTLGELFAGAPAAYQRLLDADAEGLVTLTDDGRATARRQASRA